MSIAQLQQEFKDALASENVEEIDSVLKAFDLYCRTSVESEHNAESKKQLIVQLETVQKQWQSEILQLKAKVRGNIADIKSNGKKINKYLTSF
jgi:molecular chaperone GrpE (heat shock protein)